LIALLIAFGSAYHSRPNGSESEIRSTPRLSLRGRTSSECKFKFAPTLRIEYLACGRDFREREHRPVAAYRPFLHTALVEVPFL
jgi:hypothetical protein